VIDGCDLLDAASWSGVFDGCTYVHHCASPFFLAVDDPQTQFVTPAVDGTLNVLRAARAAGTVRRVVLTSSCAAVSWQDAKGHPDGPEHVWTEDDWQEDNTLEKGPYRLSKRMAEHAAWDFVAEHKCFELATICPTFILGPVLSPRADATSIQFMRGLVDGSTTEVTGAAFGVVDVRHVATAHVAAMTVDLATPGLKNKHGEARFIVSSDRSYPQIEVCKALAASPVFGAGGWPVPTKATGPPLQELRYGNDRATKYLGVDFGGWGGVEKMIHDGCLSMVQMGLATKPRL